MTTGFTVEHVFSIGSILSRTFSTLVGKPAVFFGLAAISMVPTFLVGLLDPSSVFLIFIGSCIDSIITLLIQGAMAYATYQVLSGEDEVTIGETVSAAMPHLLPLLGVAILTGIGISIGMMLLIIPGIILMCIWAVSMQACIVEDLGVLDSISRSADLTKYYRLQIFVLMFLVGIVTVLFGVVDIMSAAEGPSAGWSLISAALQTLPAAFSGVMSAIIYYDLRAVKEGLDLDHLVKIFD